MTWLTSRRSKGNRLLATGGIALTITTCYIIYWNLFWDTETKDDNIPMHFDQTEDFKVDTNVKSFYPLKPPENFHYICPAFDGGIGNQMFQFASSYGVARLKNMTVLISANCTLMQMFDFNVTIVGDISVCKKFRVIRENQNAIFDKRLLSFDPNTNVRLTIYLQSHRYFDTYRSDLRKQFTFRNHILEKANAILEENLRRFKMTCTFNDKKLSYSLNLKRKYNECYDSRKQKITLIGLHVRRGDWLRSPHPQKGFVPATKDYLQRAIAWYQDRFENLVFIISTNGLNWTRTNIPKNITTVYLGEGNPPFIDMAVLSLCNHFISTVGTFGWWTGWLTGGNVTYFKWPARENTEFRRSFNKDFSDHFYSTWIGL